MSRSHNNVMRTPIQIFRVPLSLAALSMVGLISALLGDNVWDVLSWAALFIPVATVIWTLWPGSGKGPAELSEG